MSVPSQSEELALIEAARKGDPLAYGPLMDRFHAMVYGLCLRLTACPSEADELAHDTFVEAWLKLGQLREPRAFGGWLKTLALNLCRMRRRSQRRFLPLDENAADPQTLGALYQHGEATSTGPADPRMLRMGTGLAQLPPAQRLVLALHYGEGLSCEQIGRFLELRPGTVMSRLFRARAALRELVDKTCSDEESPKMTDEIFKQDVQAELTVLLHMFRGQAKTGERLAVVLERSPQRLAALVCEQAENPELKESLARVMPRLGGQAMQLLVEMVFGTQDEPARQARQLLKQVMGCTRPMDKPDAMPGTPAAEAYWTLDAILASPAGEREKVTLLLELGEACQDPPTTGLLLGGMLGWPEAAWSLLMERFEASEWESAASSAALVMLCRFGERFLRVLCERLEQSGRERLELVLAAAEAFASAYDQPWMQEMTPEQWEHEQAGRGRFCALRQNELSPALLARFSGLLAALMQVEDGTLQRRVATMLGQLRAHEHVQAVNAALQSTHQPVRLAALRALACLGESSVSTAEIVQEAFARFSRQGTSLERRASVEGLARLQRGESFELLEARLCDEDQGVRLAAISAMGELQENEQARQRLTQLLAMGSDAERKAAARALYGKEPSKRVPLEAELRREERMRGGARPFASISLAAAIRFLPDTGPYPEHELTGRIARVCYDYSATRRYLIEKKLMTRANGVYELTPLGQAVWRVERFVFTGSAKRA